MVSFFLALMLNTHVLALPPLRCNRHLSNHTRSARRYYVNTLTDETSWEKPSAEELNAAAVSQRGNLSDHDNLIVAVLSVLANMMYENDANIGRFIAASGVPTYVFLRVYVSASFDCGLFKSRSLCLYGALSLATAATSHSLAPPPHAAAGTRRRCKSSDQSRRPSRRQCVASPTRCTFRTRTSS